MAKLKYLNSQNEYEEVPYIKGEKGDKGDAPDLSPVLDELKRIVGENDTSLDNYKIKTVRDLEDFFATPAESEDYVFFKGKINTLDGTSSIPLTSGQYSTLIQETWVLDHSSHPDNFTHSVFTIPRDGKYYISYQLAFINTEIVDLIVIINRKNSIDRIIISNSHCKSTADSLVPSGSTVVDLKQGDTVSTAVIASNSGSGNPLLIRTLNGIQINTWVISEIYSGVKEVRNCYNLLNLATVYENNKIVIPEIKVYRIPSTYLPEYLSNSCEFRATVNGNIISYTIKITRDVHIMNKFSVASKPIPSYLKFSRIDLTSISKDNDQIYYPFSSLACMDNEDRSYIVLLGEGSITANKTVDSSTIIVTLETFPIPDDWILERSIRRANEFVIGGLLADPQSFATREEITELQKQVKLLKSKQEG